MKRGIKKFQKKNAEDLYNAFVQAPVAICIFSGQDNIIDFANDFCLKLIARQADIIGTPFFASFPELINQALEEFIDSVIKSEDPFYINEQEMKISRNSIDEICFFNCTYQLFSEQNSQITSTIVAFTEVTAQVKLRNLNFKNQKIVAIDLEKAQSELVFQKVEKGKRAEELGIANIELAFQDDEKEKRAQELIIANKELLFQNKEKGKRAAELIIANTELIFQNNEKEKRAQELSIANTELIFQNNEKEKRAQELSVANIELAFQNNEKEKRAQELSIANIELAFQNNEKEKRAQELSIANIELAFQNNEKEKRAQELSVANIELAFQNNEKEKRAQELSVANIELAFQNNEKEKRAQELSVANIELAFQNNEKEKRTTELGIATELAMNAVKAKQQFLSNMSHEIRTPMNAIIGFTKVLLKTDLTAKQKEYLLAIQISGNALIVLINDILDLAKVDAGKMNFESTPFKLAMSISAMLHIFESQIQEKNLVLITEYDPRIPEVIAGDSVRLHQIIMNLVSNAIKFTPSGSITVTVCLLEEDDEKVKIEFAIKDTGIGITHNKMEKIFDNFQQATSGTSRLYGGTGLGLAIVKQLVERQNGNIKVESTVGEGSKFSFILDFQKTEANADEIIEMIRVNSEIKNIKVLVVEDIPLNQLLMKTILDDFGFGRDIAANGKLAIERMKTEIYDVILMDLQMPEMNGFEATEYIRNVLKSDVPIIALTADVTTVDEAKCRAVGMNDYISKPVDEQLLYSKIMGLVKRATPKKKAETEKARYTDLSYLIQRTKSNPVLIKEMITMYLEQTPPLILTMKRSLQEKDWGMLGNTVHKMIPSFSIVGFNTDFEIMAKQIQEYAKSQQLAYKIIDLVTTLENACKQACQELEEELTRI